MKIPITLLGVLAAAAAAQAVDFTTLDGKVLLGYQGWFNCPGDGAVDRGWRSWARDTPSATWLYQGLAGIRPDPAVPGFKQIIIKPAVVGDLTWVKCRHDSPYGRIVSNWKRTGQKLTMEVTIPANTTATVHVPAKAEAGVTESGRPATKAMGVKFLRMENNAAVYAVGSGSYRFGSSLTDTVK